MTTFIIANMEQNDVVVDGKKMKYEGNVIIGDARKYADMYAIVSDVAYQTISQSVKTIGVVACKGNPKKRDFPDIKRESKIYKFILIFQHISRYLEEQKVTCTCSLSPKD